MNRVIDFFSQTLRNCCIRRHLNFGDREQSRRIFPHLNDVILSSEKNRLSDRSEWEVCVDKVCSYVRRRISKTDVRFDTDDTEDVSL